MPVSPTELSLAAADKATAEAITSRQHAADKISAGHSVNNEDHSGQALNSILPQCYLESYPFPAFVVTVGSPGEGSLSTSGQSRFSQHPPIWSNECWTHVARGRSLFDCLSPDGSKDLSNWLFDKSSPRAEAEGDGGTERDMHRTRGDSDTPNSWTQPRSKTLTLVLALPERATSFKFVKTWQLISTQRYAVITTIPCDEDLESARPCATSKQPGSPLRKSETAIPVDRGPGESRDGSTTYPLFEAGSGDVLRKLKEAGWEDGDAVYFENGTVRFTPSHLSRSSSPTDVWTLLDARDWSMTPLGPREQWSSSLSNAALFVLQHPFAACICWGQEHTCIYNQGWAAAIPDHPEAFGRPATPHHSRVVDGVARMLTTKGSPVFKEDEFYLHHQSDGDAIWEAYRSHAFFPIRDEHCEFQGVFQSLMDTTSRVISDRRTAILRDWTDEMLGSRTEDELDRRLLDTLGKHPKDVPFALLFNVAPELKQNKAHDEPQPVPSSYNVKYVGGVGVPEGHESAPLSIVVALPRRPADVKDITAVIDTAFTDLRLVPSPIPAIEPATESPGVSRSWASTSSNPCTSSTSPRRVRVAEGGVTAWPIQEALLSRQPVYVRDCKDLIGGYPLRIWDEVPTSAIVVPIYRESESEVPAKILVIGLSTRRPFDTEYERFINSLKIQIVSGIAHVRSYMSEIKHVKELAAIERARSLLFANVSHELRTPLTLIAGPIEDLIAVTPPGPPRDALTMAMRNIRRLNRLVSMLLDLSRLEAGRAAGSFSKVNLGAVTQDIAGLFRLAIERNNIEYVVDCDLTAHDVYVDPEKWEKILFNVIGNAMKYTSTGVGNRIAVSLKYSKTEAICTVEDSGIGILSRDLDRIGERFFRAESVAKAVEGTGIGLELTKRLIEFHSGVLDVRSKAVSESEDGLHGSVFTIRLPLGRDHLQDESIDINKQYISDKTVDNFDIGEWMDVDGQEDWDVPLSLISGPGRVDPSTLYFKKDDLILVVDDSADTRRYVRSILSPYCSVEEAQDGLEALEKCAARPPDLIISDVMMPRMDGFGLLRALKSGTREQQLIPFLFLTAMGDGQMQGLLAGADDYLSTPFSSRELIARSHMQLQLGKKRRALEKLFDERTEELSMLTDLSPVAVFRVTPDGTVTYANAAWYEISGYPPNKEVVNWGDYIMESGQEQIKSLWTSFLASDEPEVRAEWQWKNGRHVQTKVIRITTPDGKTFRNGCLGAVIDVTQRKVIDQLHNERLRDAEQRREEAEEAKRQQEMLIDMTSHEIRNPISSLMQMSHCSSLVKTNLLVLEEAFKRAVESGTTFTPTEQVLRTLNDDLEALESIYQCALTQERISNDVLSLGKIQLDMLEMFDVEADVRKETQKLIQVFQSEARMKRVDLSLVISDTFDKLGVRAVMTDPVRLGQVITNLLSNAIRFTANSYVRKIRLTVDAGMRPPTDGTCARPPSSDDDIGLVRPGSPLYLFIAVSDTGPGLTESELGRLFHRFSQASAKTHTVFGGSGLGLFVCRKITERMGGQIEVVSKKGEGSTFRFFVKVHVVQSKPISATTGSQPPVEVGQTWELNKPHVLVVEDNVINQTVLRRQLRHVGLTVDVADNGLSAVQMIRRAMAIKEPGSMFNGHYTVDKHNMATSAAKSRGDEDNINDAEADETGTSAEPEKKDRQEERKLKPYDCVLMDLEMPIMDGYTAAHMIREDEAAGKISATNIVALTGNARQAQIDEVMVDFDDAIVKPYRLDHLLRTIDTVVKLSPGHRRSRRIGSLSYVPASEAAKGETQTFEKPPTERSTSL